MVICTSSEGEKCWEKTESLEIKYRQEIHPLLEGSNIVGLPWWLRW